MPLTILPVSEKLKSSSAFIAASSSFSAYCILLSSSKFRATRPGAYFGLRAYSTSNAITCSIFSLFFYLTSNRIYSILALLWTNGVSGYILSSLRFKPLLIPSNATFSLSADFIFSNLLIYSSFFLSSLLVFAFISVWIRRSSASRMFRFSISIRLWSTQSNYSSFTNIISLNKFEKRFFRYS